MLMHVNDSCCVDFFCVLVFKIGKKLLQAVDSAYPPYKQCGFIHIGDYKTIFDIMAESNERYGMFIWISDFLLFFAETETVLPIITQFFNYENNLIMFFMIN